MAKDPSSTTALPATSSSSVRARLLLNSDSSSESVRSAAVMEEGESAWNESIVGSFHPKYAFNQNISNASGHTFRDELMCAIADPLNSQCACC